VAIKDLMQRALKAAKETRVLEIAPGAMKRVADIYRSQFGEARAIVVADTRTFAAAGKSVLDQLRAKGIPCDEPFIFTEPDLHAEWCYIERLEAVLKKTDATPVAVGSGTVNDLTKLSSHHVGRPYMVVGTAASMDGYTSFGASIVYQGAKLTFDCAAPRAVLTDLEVVARAPEGMNAWGYADLAAKLTGGADWIVADALGEDPIDATAWELVQSRLREALSDPAGVKSGKMEALEGLVAGLMMGGFAMQWTRTSRPASGAEHLFSHIWDMEHHTHNGAAPSHGFKVGIATLAETRLYEQLYKLPLEKLDVQRLARQWPEWEEQAKQIRSLFNVQDIIDVAMKESQAKYLDRQKMVGHLQRICTAWPGMRKRLQQQLLSSEQLRQMLADVGAPTEPEEIGITKPRLRHTYHQATYMRRRYTVLDMVLRVGCLETCLDGIFGRA
jgi:glycerol-1-phosphate dehydrogenase [NAD(P)+]